MVIHVHYNLVILLPPPSSIPSAAVLSLPSTVRSIFRNVLSIKTKLTTLFFQMYVPKLWSRSRGAKRRYHSLLCCNFPLPKPHPLKPYIQYIALTCSQKGNHKSLISKTGSYFVRMFCIKASALILLPFVLPQPLESSFCKTWLDCKWWKGEKCSRRQVQCLAVLHQNFD